MTLETVTCAMCGHQIYLDQNHVRIEAEKIRVADRNALDEFAAHPECWDKLTDDWPTPA